MVTVVKSREPQITRITQMKSKKVNRKHTQNTRMT